MNAEDYNRDVEYVFSFFGCDGHYWHADYDSFRLNQVLINKAMAQNVSWPSLEDWVRRTLMKP